MVYDSPDQPYSFQKHVQFGDRPNQPDLESDAAESGISSESPTTVPRQLPARSSTPYRRTSQGPMNRTFDISNISPTNFGAAQDAAMIAAEVSAAATAQAPKEFWRMREPKIAKLRGGYSTDADLVFRSWLIFRIGSWITRLLSSSSRNKHWTTLAVRSSSNCTSAVE